MWLIRSIIDWFRAKHHDGQRELYEFFDGRRMRRADPWKIHRALIGAPGFSLEQQLQAAVRGDEPELTKAIEAICAAFDVKELDDAGGGLSTVELFALLDHYLRWSDDIQKKTLGLPTQSPASDPVSSDGRDFLAQATS